MTSVFSVTDDAYGIALDDSETLAAYVVDDEEPTLVETGTTNQVSALISGIEAVGIDPASLRHAVIGHYHLDHSGGAPALLEMAPDLTCYLHESMASWVTDPEQFEMLVESTAAVFDEKFEEMGAPAHPIPTDRRVLVGDDGLTLDVGTATLELVHTPGHTPDHLSAYLPTEAVLFANEAIGRYFPRTDAFHPPATVPTFDLDATADSIDRLASYSADAIALTHYGVRDDPAETFDLARRQLDRFHRRIGELYDECDEDVDETVVAVRQELIDLDDGYPDAVAATQAEVCTRGFLTALGRL